MEDHLIISDQTILNLKVLREKLSWIRKTDWEHETYRESEHHKCEICSHRLHEGDTVHKASDTWLCDWCYQTFVLVNDPEISISKFNIEPR